MAKLGTAALVAALAMALLGYAGSGQLGNFGGVGVDQGTLLIGGFFWFAVVGWVTVVMAGGIRYRLRRPRPKRPPAAPVDEVVGEPPVDEVVEPADFAEPFEALRKSRAATPPIRSRLTTPARRKPRPRRARRKPRPRRIRRLPASERQLRSGRRKAGDCRSEAGNVYAASRMSGARRR